MAELQITKDELVEKLQTEIVQLKFIKADGSERHMVCTKSIIHIPTEFHPKTDKVVKLDDNMLVQMQRLNIMLLRYLQYH